MNVMTVSAYGDALGAPYEFNEYTYRGDKLELLPHSIFPAGEWTDDTYMAYCIGSAAINMDLTTTTGLDLLSKMFVKWYIEDGSGVGIQTSFILGNKTVENVTAEELMGAAKLYYSNNINNAAGNGSLMRVHPVSLISNDRKAVAEIAKNVTLLTHTDPLCVNASILWCEMLRQARISGNLNPHAGLSLLDNPQDRNIWMNYINEALAKPSNYFGNQGWWVVPSFQQALSAVARNIKYVLKDPMRIFEEIIACQETDTDTICAIAGGLMGALGTKVSDLPNYENLHGSWPVKDIGYKDLQKIEDELLR